MVATGYGIRVLGELGLEAWGGGSGLGGEGLGLSASATIQHPATQPGPSDQVGVWDWGYRGNSLIKTSALP